MLLSDLITSNATNSVDWTEELAAARRQYHSQTPAQRVSSGSTTQATRNEARFAELNPALRAALASITINSRFRRDVIVRNCIRLGIPATSQLRILGSLVV